MKAEKHTSTMERLCEFIWTSYEEPKLTMKKVVSTNTWYTKIVSNREEIYTWCKDNWYESYCNILISK
jgi:hypothetical protein